MPAPSCRRGPWLHKKSSPLLGVMLLALALCGCTKFVLVKYGPREFEDLEPEATKRDLCPVDANKASDVDELILQGDQFRDDLLNASHKIKPLPVEYSALKAEADRNRQRHDAWLKRQYTLWFTAQSCYKRASELEEKNRVYLSMAVMSMHMADVAIQDEEARSRYLRKARVMLKHAEKVNSADPQNDYYWAELYVRMGEPAQAEERLRRLTAAKYPFANAYVLLAHMLERQGKIKEAIEQYTFVTEGDMDQPPLSVNFAREMLNKLRLRVGPPPTPKPQAFWGAWNFDTNDIDINEQPRTRTR